MSLAEWYSSVLELHRARGNGDLPQEGSDTLLSVQSELVPRGL